MSAKHDKENTYPLNQLYFYLTDSCNLKCRHCWLSPKHASPNSINQKTIPVEFFRSIIKEAKPLGLTDVKLTGGEPLLHPQILDLLKIVYREELRLIVETNGTLITKEIVQNMAMCKEPSISVSIDGIDSKTHEWMRGVKGSFSKSVNGILLLAEAGIHPQLIMSILNHNKDQLEEFVEMAERLGADSVKFNPVQPTGRGEEMVLKDQTISISQLLQLGEWIETTLSKKFRIPIYFSHPPAFKPLGSMFSDSGDGCGVCGILNILGVLSDGTYALCGIGSLIPELSFGHCEKDKLNYIWQTNSVLTKLRDSLPDRLEGVCSRCSMKNICLGDCIAQNFYRTNSLWAPFWYCEEAEKAGLFPETRKLPIP